MEIVLSALLAVTVGVLGVFGVLLLSAQKAARAANEQSRAHAARNAQLEYEIGGLRKYSAIVDVEATVRQMRDQAAYEARNTVTQAQQLAASTVANAQTQARGLVDSARQESGKILAAAAEATKEAKRLEQTAIADARTQARGIVDSARQESGKIFAAAAEATKEAKRLEQTVIADAQTQAQGIVDFARQESGKIFAAAAEATKEVKRLEQTAIANAQAEVSRMRAEATSLENSAAASAQATVAQATIEARAVLDSARQESGKILTAAAEATKEAKRLEQTVQAMRNVIDGYGDRYVLPTSGLLDDLAEEFSFTDAGKRLKVARGHTQDLIWKGAAADCDYVEAIRRRTAIEFVLDAFNGKVDTILASVRHDNYGTLRQKVLDAHSLVNHNGGAFRNARIVRAYLDARLEELRWAVTVQELKLKEREEQRLIKERIRDEERAQREYDRAVKEAEKEEETLRKAIEKAQQEVEKASEEQKAKYERQLQELSEKLRVAEERGQRAISMAQQTKSGHVYIISNVGSFGDDVFKIGQTRRLEPLERVRELGDASVPFEFDVHALIMSQDAPALEHALHKRFVRCQVNKVNPRKEFFRIGLGEIREEVERLGIQVTWTMAAACREFRESQAVERALAEKTIDEVAWKKAQLAREASAEREVIEASV